MSKNGIKNFNTHENNVTPFPQNSYQRDDKRMTDDKIIEILFKELKDDMRERENRSEKKWQEQQEIIANKLDVNKNELRSEIKDVRLEMKEMRSGLEKEIKESKGDNRRWSFGILITIIASVLVPLLIPIVTNYLSSK